MSPDPTSAVPAPRPSERAVGGLGFRLFVLAAALSLAFAAGTLYRSEGLDPTARDQVHDMTLAVRLREGTSLSDGNRHPLYPALLAPVATREPEFFASARVVSAALAGASLLLVYAAVAGVYGPVLALLSLLGLLLEFRLEARRLCPEPLLAALLAAAAATLARAPGLRRPWLGFLAAGAWTGLAWLAKGSALLSLGAAGASVLVAGGRPRVPRLLALLLGFVLLASPLLVWNVAQGRSPVFNVNSAHVMWEDSWDVELDRRSTATAAGWFQAHGVGEAAARLGDGLTRQRGVEWVYGFAVVCLGASLVERVARRRRRRADPEAAPPPEPPGPRRAWRTVAAWTAILWLPAFAWYAPVVASRRLLFPIFPVLLPPALWAVARALRAVAPKGLPALLARGAVALRSASLPLAGLLGAAALALLLATGNPWARPGVDPAFVAAGRLLWGLDPTGARVLVRPSRTYPPDWLVEGRATYVALPASVSDAEVPGWLRSHVEYVLLNEGLLRNRPGAFGPSVRWDPARGVVADAIPPWGFDVWRDDAQPSRWLLLRVSR